MKELEFFKFTPSVWIVPTFTVLLLWLLFFADRYFNLDLNNYGIYPRTTSGLTGVVLSPLLHADLEHITNNTVPLFVLMVALIYFYRDLSLKVLLYGILFSGLITWLIGRQNIHIGASGLIYVLVSFIFFKGMFTGYYRLMALSFAVVLVYGGMVWYIFPEVDRTISWEGHLAGFLVGLGFALYFKTPNYVEEIQFDWQKPDFDPMQDPFMKRFDENGNFVNPPKAEEMEVEYEEIFASTSFYVPYRYEYKPSDDYTSKNGFSTNPD